MFNMVPATFIESCYVRTSSCSAFFKNFRAELSWLRLHWFYSKKRLTF